MDQDLIALLDERFWFVVFDAEEKKDVPFNGNVYHYKPSGNNTGVNELAEQLGTIENELRYPATCVLNPDYQIIFQYNQFLSPEQLKTILLEVLKNSD